MSSEGMNYLNDEMMIKSTTQYVVLNEHTLGYIYPQQPNQVNVLHHLERKGASWNLYNYFQLISPLCVIRPATLADFDEYRVSPPPCIAA